MARRNVRMEPALASPHGGTAFHKALIYISPLRASASAVLQDPSP